MRRNPIVVGGVAAMALISILLIAGDPGWSERPLGPAEIAGMLDKMFPGSTFRDSAGDTYVDDKDRTFVVNEAAKGSFTRAGAREILLAVSRLSSELAHAERSYNGYAAVFDKEGRAPVSDVMKLVSDKGYVAVLDGRRLDYLLFIGSAAFQGWEEWTGGLWKAGAEWTRVWPEDPMFWKDIAVQPDDGKLAVFTRKVSLKPGQAVPEYTFEFGYHLRWNPESETLERVTTSP